MPALPVSSETQNMSKVLVGLIAGGLLAASSVSAGLKPGAYERATTASAGADDAKASATIAEKTAGAQKLTGYFNLYCCLLYTSFFHVSNSKESACSRE